MSDKEYIQSLLNEGGLYRRQSLLDQALEKYQEALDLILNHPEFSMDKKIIEALKQRIRDTNNDIIEINEAPITPELSEDLQNLIGKLFSFSDNNDLAAIEGAVALAKFGQYKKALKELRSLIESKTLPLLAAKNILRCHLTLSTPDNAINEFKGWISENIFSVNDLQNLKSFLENALENSGISEKLPDINLNQAAQENNQADEDDEIIDISSLSIKLQNGPRKGEDVEFMVAFQSGNTVSVIVPAAEKAIVQAFQSGMRIDEMQCFAPMGFFSSCGMVSGFSKIPSGPKGGDYALDITLLGS